MKLEELKARSKDCGFYPRLIEIAQNAQSPTAAYEWAKKERFEDFDARACRFLAIIKRDFSKKSFEKVVAEIQQEATSYMSHYFLLPIIQTATRIEFLYSYLNRNNLESLKLAEHDKPYADIIEDCVQRIAELPSPIRQQIIEHQTYLDEAELIVREIRQSVVIGEYRLEKTFKVLSRYVYVVGKKRGIQNSLLRCCDTINSRLAGRK
ncbi:hypothetical protein KJ756_02835 [Patescibacteria group bacterium]|nr:hypothetical protein [Patescibacteria group bacterium]MBU4082658.1 hypothetical protein [Patescibacteria group bacterium]